jgi:hypothetical protein
MGGRLDELLSKGRAGRLSKDETEELASLLNAPILDPLGQASAGFVSKHTFVKTDVASRIRAIKWFGHIGEPLTLSSVGECAAGGPEPAYGVASSARPTQMPGVE